MAQAALDPKDGKFVRELPLGTTEILALFKSSEAVTNIPFRPSGGDLFLFSTEDPLRIDDWKSDGHTWTNQGNKKPLPRTNPKYLKSYYYIKADNRANKGFRKEVYFPIGAGNIIIHYIGDETLSVMTPHGNSNKNEPFFRTKPSVREDIQKKIEVEKPHIVYKNLVCENVEGHDAISKPRNIKQLHNAKASKQEEIRLTRDAIYNTHELAYEGGFIHFLSTYPDLCVVAGEVEMIQELNSVIQLKDEDLLLSYDTTFNLGEFYVSPLVFKHVVFTDNPLVAGLFLIHERKLSETHEHFFKILSSLVKPLKGVPIVTDMESAIVKAIRENTTLKQIGCWRHLRQDVQRWLTDNLPKVERSTYVNELYEILRTTTERQCADMIKKMEKQWNEEFTRYFKKSVEPKLGYFCAWSIANSCKLDTKNGITTNQSEGFNFLLKDFQSWKEVPLDSLLMSLKLIQGFYLEEIRRGKAQLGTFRLKPKYSRFASDVIEFASKKLVCQPKDIVSSLRDRVLKESDADVGFPKSADADNSRVLRAKLLATSDNISFSSRLGVFVIADQESVYTVKLFPTESCTCPLKKNCVHILGVKLGQRMEIHEDELAIQKNIAVVRKNTRATKQKPGRKRPRPGDVSPVGNKESKVNLDKVVNRLEESIIHPVNESQLSEKYVQELIELEEQVNAERDETKQTQTQTEQQMETEHIIEDRKLIQKQTEQQTEQQMEPLHQSPVNTEEPEYSFINLMSSTPKSPELLKDVRYSLEVWVPADKQKLFHNLNVNDRNLIQKRSGWMNDTIIDSAMNLLQFQFPDLEGFQSCTLAVQLDFQRHEKLFIQIINRSPNTKGTHWLTVSNINCMEDEVGVYDTAFDDLPHIEQLVVASLVKTEQKVLKVKFSNVYMQTNGNDCGLYAIANATALAFGRDPSKEQYIPSKLREHLLKCLEEKEMRLFPTAKGTSKRRKAIKKIEKIKLYCVCNMPDTHTTYFLCDQCSSEYHPECLGLDAVLLKDRSFICPTCSTK